MQDFTTLNQTAIDNDNMNLGLFIVIDDIKPSGAAITNADYGISSNVIYWSTVDAPDFLSGVFLSNIIIENSISKIDEKVNIENGGNIAVLSDFSFSIVNKTVSSINFIQYCRNNGIYLHNRIIRVYLCLATDKLNNTHALSDLNLVWSGIIDHYNHSFLNIQFICRSNEVERYNKIIPIRQIENDNTDWDDYVILEDNKEEIEPLVYGQMGKDGIGCYAKGYLIDKRVFESGITDGQRFLFSSDLYDCFDGGNIYLFFENANNLYCKLPIETGTPDLKQHNWVTEYNQILLNRDNDINAFYNGAFYIILFVDIACHSEPEDVFANGETNTGRAYDGDIDTYGQINSFDYDGEILTYHVMKLVLPQWQFNSESNLQAVYLIAKLTAVTPTSPTYPLGSEDFELTLAGSNVLDITSDLPFNNITGADNETDKEFTYVATDTDIKLNSIFNSGAGGTFLNLAVTAGGTVGDTNFYTTKNYEVYEASLRIEFFENITTAEVYAEMDGIIDNSTGDITGVNNGLIQFPDHIIAHIETILLKLTAPKISTTSIRNNWLFASQLLERKNIKDIYLELTKQGHFIYGINYGGVGFVSSLSYGTSIATITDDYVNLDNQKIPKIKAYLIPIDKIFNNFYIYTHYDIASDRYLKKWYIRNVGTIITPSIETNFISLGANPDGIGYNEVCSDSIKNYRVNNDYSIECNWIQDDFTAKELVKELISYFSEQRYIVEIETCIHNIENTTNNILLEIGDKVKIDNDILPTDISFAHFILFEKNIDYEKGIQTLKFRELYTPSPV